MLCCPFALPRNVRGPDTRTRCPGFERGNLGIDSSRTDEAGAVVLQKMVGVRMATKTENLNEMVLRLAAAEGDALERVACESGEEQTLELLSL
jgi:hypothetical protein